MKKTYILFNFIFICIIFSGCFTTNPGCMNDGNRELKMKWGTLNSRTGKISGYRLNNSAKLYKMNIFNGNEINDTLMISIDKEKYCRLLGMLRDTILNVQALSEPGDSLHFIEYSDQPRNVKMRAVWNPVYKTIGSKGFREIYDSLQALVPVVR